MEVLGADVVMNKVRVRGCSIDERLGRISKSSRRRPTSCSFLSPPEYFRAIGNDEVVSKVHSAYG